MKKLILLGLLLLAACGGHQTIVNSVDEREANEIVVFLASRGIAAQKLSAPAPTTGGGAAISMFNIGVSSDQATEAMALLNRFGLPRRQGTDLLTLFAKGGLMSSDREETIRYQAGLAQELANTIRKIDGVLEADVQISFPPSETTAMPGAPVPKITASVFVKHQGIMEDPNSHMEVKIKRLMAASVNGLSYDDVSVVSDRARFADISLEPNVEMIGPKALQQAYVKIWGMVLSKESLLRFRFIFFLLIIFLLVFSAAIGWLIYKFYPLMRKPKEAAPPPEMPPPGP